MAARRLPIRWRLTVWYGALMLAGFFVIGTGLYLALRITLYDAFDEQLAHQAALALSGVRTDGGTLTLDDATRAAMLDDEHVVQFFDRSGALVLDAGGANGRPSPYPAAVASALNGHTANVTRRLNGTTYGITVLPVRNGAAVVGAAAIGASRGDEDQTLRLVLIVLGLAAPLVALAAVFGGYLLAGRVLDPVAAITRLAGAIGANDLHARLALDLPDDELGRLAQTFDAMLARIEAQVERQRRFTGDAAHELRTPVAFLRSEVDLALAAPRSTEEYRAAIARMDGDLRRLTDLLGALLTLARADEDRLVIERQPFDLAETIVAVGEQFAVEAQAAGIALASEAPPVRVAGDEDLVVQVLINLVTNALRHTDAGGRIVLGCRAEGEVARAWVEDSGEGIAPEHRERVFDRFSRIDSGRSRERGGAGLGLSICREIVRAHGGAIALTSEPGRGTRVEFTLPLAPE